jgi:8-oxo-dGTP pyrophosphatase MutT (NUDIX family)
MTDKIINIFSKRKGSVIGEYKKNSVMIFLMEEKGELEVLFEVRSKNLRRQPGDICLPGGKIEKGELPLDAACRESMEELQIKRDSFSIIGEMDYLVTPYNFIIYPYLATIKLQEIHPNPEEVERILKVPLKFFLETEPIYHEIEIVQTPREDFPYELINRGNEYKFTNIVIHEYFYTYQGNVIWGFTALIMKRFADIIRDSKQ